MVQLTTLLLVLFTLLSVIRAPMAASAAILPGAASGVGIRTESAPAFSSASAVQHVDALSVGIGSRVAGSSAMPQTHLYLSSKFQEYGYRVELQPFTISAYQDRGSTLRVAGAATPSVQANTLQYSAAGAVEAPLIEAGLGRADEFAGVDARGKVVLVMRGGDIRFAEKVQAAENAGAAAVIIANNQPGNFNGSLSSMSTIPAISVSQADGATLLDAIRAGGAAARVEVDASNEQNTAHNVIATRPGGSQTLVIGGHIDSVAAGPGANDNASGTAVVLELARVLAATPSTYTLKFIGFDAEEIGLIGSNYYVSQLSESEKRSIVGMINLDMVGVGESSRVGGSESLVRLARASAERSGLALGQMGDGGGGSDHAPFIRAGIPGLFIHRTNDPNYHSPNDRAEFIDPENLQIAGQLTLDVVAALERGE